MSDYVTLDEFRAKAQRILNEPQEPAGDDGWWWANAYLVSFARQALDVVESLEVLRSAWNKHMDNCPHHAALPDLPAPTWEELEAWRNAPSGTASSVGFEKIDPLSDPTSECGENGRPGLT